MRTETHLEGMEASILCEAAAIASRSQLMRLGKYIKPASSFDDCLNKLIKLGFVHQEGELFLTLVSRCEPQDPRWTARRI